MEQHEAHGAGGVYIPVAGAMPALINGFTERAGLDTQTATILVEQLVGLLETRQPFLQKISALDRYFDRQERYQDLREQAFDLLMVNFLAKESLLQDPDYLESEEWIRIEDQTLERGSELLNVLLYLTEAHEADVPPTLDDFLKEFLLVGDDMGQEEFIIYEDLIANQHLVEEDFDSIITAISKSRKPESFMDEFMLPLIIFFKAPESLSNFIPSLLKNKRITAVEAAILCALNAYQQTLMQLGNNFIDPN